MKTYLTSQQNRNLIDMNYELISEINKIKNRVSKMNITDEVVLMIIEKELTSMKRKVKSNNFILANYPTISKNL